jgi:hypothetical protein
MQQNEGKDAVFGVKEENARKIRLFLLPRIIIRPFQH